MVGYNNVKLYAVFGLIVCFNICQVKGTSKGSLKVRVNIL